MNLLDLPPEILLIILSFLDREQDIYTLTLTNKPLSTLANPHLYTNNARKHNSSALLWAAEHNKQPTAELSLRHGGNINATDSDGRTPLFWTSWQAHNDLARFFLRIGKGKIDVNLKENRGVTPLNYACMQGNTGIVRMLLETGKADVNTPENGGLTPIGSAAQIGNVPIVTMLLATEGINVNAADSIFARAPICLAADGGYADVMRLLLETGQVDLDDQNWRIQSSFFWAVNWGYEGVVRLFLATGKVDVNAALPSQGTPPLCQAARNGRVAIVKMFIEFALDGGGEGSEGEDVQFDIRDQSCHRTPLGWAALGGHVDVAEVLLSTGRVDIDSRDGVGQTPLSLAAQNGHTRVVQMLLEAGKKGLGSVSVDPESDLGRTPLSLAAQGGWHAVVKLLIQTGQADVNAVDSEWRRTPLSWAAGNGHVEVVQLLLATGRADLDSRDGTFQRTALEWAAENGYDAVVELLEQQGHE
ncbi:ankyrin repeat-containing domain protein [Aspergillus keveii]|uniref:Ankyrin repeat-containing domain protein n=1 Tax=Aspergillus keveii TaxID=714993 RepID=A0ABR4G2E9_9EURO